MVSESFCKLSGANGDSTRVEMISTPGAVIVGEGFHQFIDVRAVQRARGRDHFTCTEHGTLLERVHGLYLGRPLVDMTITGLLSQ